MTAVDTDLRTEVLQELVKGTRTELIAGLTGLSLEEVQVIARDAGAPDLIKVRQALQAARRSADQPEQVIEPAPPVPAPRQPVPETSVASETDVATEWATVLPLTPKWPGHDEQRCPTCNPPTAGPVLASAAKEVQVVVLSHAAAPVLASIERGWLQAESIASLIREVLPQRHRRGAMCAQCQSVRDRL